MKLIQVVLFDPANEEILSVGDLDLPSMEIDEQHKDSFEAAQEVLAKFGYECCAMSRIFNNEKTEIWQALDVAEMLDFEGIQMTMEWIPQWLAEDFVDCKTNGSWRRKLLRRNVSVPEKA